MQPASLTVASLLLRILPACLSWSDLQVLSPSPMFGGSCSTPAAAHTTGGLARAFLVLPAGGRLAHGLTLSCRTQRRGLVLGSNFALAAGPRCVPRRRGLVLFPCLLRLSEQNSKRGLMLVPSGISVLKISLSPVALDFQFPVHSCLLSRVPSTTVKLLPLPLGRGSVLTLCPGFVSDSCSG